jgi:SulP family sulfate permease
VKATLFWVFLSIHYNAQMQELFQETARKFAMHTVATFTPWRTLYASYTRTDLRADTLAGLTVAGIIIPQSMAQALLVGVPPVYGLYALLVAAGIGALFGSSRFVVTAPVAVVSLLTLTALLPHATRGTSEYIALAVVLAFLVGVIQLAAGYFQLGFLSRLIPHSVLIGFSVSAGIIIALLQVPNLLGFSVAQEPFVFETLRHLLFSFSHIHLLTAGIGVSAFLVVWFGKKLLPTFPVALAVLGASIPLSIVLDIGSYGVPLVGDVPAGIPAFLLPSLSLTGVLSIIGSACVIALVGFMETYAIGSALAKKHQEHVAPNQELVGQGMANIAASFVGGYPVSGSFSASAVNESSGARTAFSGVILSLATMCTLLFFTWFLSYLPKTILAAIIIASVSQLIRLRDIRRAFFISRDDGVLALATFGIALIVKPDSAIIAGVVLALVLFVNRIMWPSVDEMGIADGEPVMRPVAEDGVHTLPGIVCVRPQLSLLYANVEYVIEQLHSIMKRHPDAHTLAIHFGSINHIDLTGVEALGTFFKDMRARSVSICIIGIKHKEQLLLERAARMVGQVNHYTTVAAFLQERKRSL